MEFNENCNLNAQNLVIFAGGQNPNSSCGSWLTEDKKLISGIEGKIVMAHGRLPFPALSEFFVQGFILMV